MHIERISTRVLALPVERPYRLSLGVLIESIGHVLVEAHSNEGHVGTAYAYSLYGQLPALRAAIDELKELAIGKDPFAVKTIWRNMMAYTGWFGPGGFLHLAISGIDVALWDLGSDTYDTLKGHGGGITGLSFSEGGRLLGSRSRDGTVRLWSPVTKRELTRIDEPHSGAWQSNLAFSPREDILAALGKGDRVIRIWEVDIT